MGFEYPAFLVKINLYKWLAGYLLLGAIFMTLLITIGHSSMAWVYPSLGVDIVFVVVSFHGMVKGWLHT